MRKRIVIGLLIVLVSGVGGYCVLQRKEGPKPGTVAHHFQECKRACDRRVGLDWRSELGDAIDQKMGVRLRFLYANSNEKARLEKEMDRHFAALKELGSSVQGGEVVPLK